jgi:hypothetical protein
MPEQTPFEVLQSATNDYREAIEGIISDSNVDIEARIEFAALESKIFDLMKKSRIYIIKYYGG